MNDPGLVAANGPGAHTTPGQFEAAGIVNHRRGDASRYSYATSSINEYYRSILEMSACEWPGGIRCLHGEDRED